MSKIYISKHDIGILSIAALRYSIGRKTTMPDTVIGIARQYIHDFCDSDIVLMWQDCERQERYEKYGDPVIDKPIWIQWAEIVKAEKERRKL